MPNNQVYVAELNRWDSSSAPLLLLRLMRDLEVFAEELCTAEETIGQPVWTYHDPLVWSGSVAWELATKRSKISSLGDVLSLA